MDENRGPGGVDTDHPWSTPSFCPVASRSSASTKAGDAQPFSRVCFEGFCASREVQGGQGHSCASRGGPLCIGRSRIDGEGSIAGSSPEGKDGGQSCQTSPRTSGRGSRSHQQVAICFGFVGTRQSRCRTFEGFSEEGSRAVSCSTTGRTVGFLSSIHRTCERTRVSCRGQDPRSPGRQAVGRISIGPGSADEGGGKCFRRSTARASSTVDPDEELQRLRVQVAKLEAEIARHRPSRGFLQPTSFPWMACQNHPRCRGSVQRSQR